MALTQLGTSVFQVSPFNATTVATDSVYLDRMQSIRPSAGHPRQSDRYIARQSPQELRSKQFRDHFPDNTFT
jgi:hypothetical protein